MSEVIDQIGMIEREVDTDLFSAVVHHIIGQQISTKAQGRILAADEGDFGRSECCNVPSVDISKLQSLGMTFRKAEYINGLCQKGS